MLKPLPRIHPSTGRTAALISLLALAGTPHLQAQETTPTDFQACVAGLKDKAVQAGISPKTTDEVLSRVTFLDRVIELDRRQPEFTTTFADYLGKRVNTARISKGRELLREHRALLDQVTRATGVPAPYLVAFWGLETNFGSYFGKMPVPSSLTTLACDPRRSTFFTEQ